MKIVNTTILYGSALVVLMVATASAQTKASFSGSCTKPDTQQSVPAGDRDGHSFVIAQGKCTVTKGKIGDATGKSGVFSEHDDVMPDRTKGWGVYVETYDSGDQVFYNYQFSVVTKDGAVQSGANTYQATGGTGKMKGIKGKGICSYTPRTDGGLNYTCVGNYTLAKGDMAAK